MDRLLPSGRVTFAFTDVVGSTSLFAVHPEEYPHALVGLRQRLEELVQQHGGVVVEHEGDGSLLAFPTAPGAVRALSALAEGLTVDPLPLGLRVRMGAHLGEAVPVGDGYISLEVSVAARVTAAAGVGQLLVTEQVAAEWSAEPDGGPALDHGLHDLKGVPQAIRILELLGDGRAPAASPSRRTNVARPRTTFHGRVAELRRLQEFASSSGLVTVTGPGGTGKTRLVTEWALAHAPHTPHGVWLTELGTLSNGAAAAEVWRAVADAGGSEGSHPVLVTRWAASRPGLLIVLDNCEHVLDAVVEVAEELLDAAADLVLVCTTREPLDVAGERVLVLPPLGRGDPASAQALFLDRARMAGATIGAQDEQTVATLCQRLDGLPLALELAASRAGAMSLVSLAELLEHDTTVLQRRGGADRQRSLEALVEWSLRLLDDQHRRAFLVLTVLSGRFDDATAQRILAAAAEEQSDPDVRMVLNRLTEKHLLDLDGPDHRMLVTLRTVGTRLRRHDPALERAAWIGLCSWAEAMGSDLATGAKGHLTLDELHDATAAARWALAEDSLTDRCLSVLAWAMPHFGVDTTMLRLATDIVTLPPSTDVDRIRLQARAWTLLRGAVPADWRERTLDLVARAERSGDDLALAAASWAAGLMANLGGALAEGLAHMSVAAELYERLGDHARAAVVRGNIATIRFDLGDLEAALAGWRATVEQLDPTEPNHAVMSANIGEVLIDLARHHEAERVLGSVITAPDTPHPLRAYASALLAEALAGQGRSALAQVTAQEARRSINALAVTHPDIAAVLTRMDASLASALSE